MPLYEYECQACHQRFEVIRKFSDPELDVCNLCGGGPIQRLASSPAIQFKGSGWYITDYSKKGKSGGDSTGTAGSTDTKSGTGDTSASTKSDTTGSKSDTTSSKSDTTAPATKTTASE
jgi:putative FmdB family regulatory protein